jgi:hypothetical protein
VRVVAATPLLQAALEHAVTTVGHRVVPSGTVAVATLRTPDQPAADTPLDISVEVERVTITLTQSPTPHVWAATLEFVRQLFDGRE